MLGKGYLFLMVFLLMPRWSWTNRLVPSFLLTKRHGAPQGEVLGRMSPSSSSFTSCFFNSINSSGHILYGCREIGCVPGSSSITNSIARIGGIPGNSSGKTSGNSRTTLTSSIKGATPAFKAYKCVDPAVEPHVYQTSTPESCVSNTVWEGQSILPLCLKSQSMPRMTSMSERGKTISGAEK